MPRPFFQDLSERLKSLTVWLASILIDAALLCAWLGVQHGVNLLLKTVHLSEIDHRVLTAFQIILACATLLPILIYIYTDLRIVYIRAQERINRESSSGTDEDKDEV